MRNGDGGCGWKDGEGIDRGGDQENGITQYDTGQRCMIKYNKIQ